MKLYDKYVLPRVIDAACGSRQVMEQRRKIVPCAEGAVLEVGLGSGINIPLYDPARVAKLWGLEPSAEMRALARGRVEAGRIDIELLGLPGEEIPLKNSSVDTVVLTYALCTIPGAVQAVREMRRVLKPGGRLLFSEHGRAPDAAVRYWQSKLNATWGRLAGGCHIDRDIPALLREGGFSIADLQTAYMPRTPRIAGFTYWGAAN